MRRAIGLDTVAHQPRQPQEMCQGHFLFDIEGWRKFREILPKLLQEITYKVNERDELNCLSFPEEIRSAFILLF